MDSLGFDVLLQDEDGTPVGTAVDLPSAVALLAASFMRNGLAAMAVDSAGAVQAQVGESNPASWGLLIEALTPETIEIGAPDIVLTVTGQGFEQGVVITFNGGEEPTTWVSATELSTTVKPSTASTPGSYPVNVRGRDGAYSNSLDFTFTEPALPLARE